MSKRLGLCLLSQAALVGGSHAADRTWGGGSVANWNTSANWGGTAPANNITDDRAIFNDSTLNPPAPASPITAISASLTANRSVNAIVFDTTQAAVTIRGSFLMTLGGGGVTNAGGQAHKFDNVTLALGGNRTIDTGTGSILLQAATVLANSGTAGGITKLGSGRLTLSGTGTHSLDTVLSSGTLELQHFNALVNSTLDTGTSGTRSVIFRETALEDEEVLGVNDGSAVAFGTYHLGGLKGGLNLAINSTDLIDSLVGARSLSVGSNGSSNVYSGSITGDGSFTKVGTGMQTFSGNNAYTGFTKVAAGELRINGSTAGGSVVSVLDQARLSGIGTVGGATTVQSGATHAPGESPGLQTFTTGITYNTGSIFEWELGSKVSTQSGGLLPGEGEPVTPGTAVRGSNFDAVDVTGSTTIQSGAIFKIVLGEAFNRGSAFWDRRQVWEVFNTTGAQTGVFNTFQIWDTSGQITEASVMPGYFSFGWGTDSLGAEAGNLIWTPIPEPGNALVGLILGAGLLKRRRKLVTA